LDEKDRERRTSEARAIFRKAKGIAGSIPKDLEAYISPKIWKLFQES
jgi:hypothetical protein